MSTEDLIELNVYCVALAELVKSSFPPLPAEWEAFEAAVTWRSKVVRTFEAFKSCGLSEFREICERLEGELKV